MGPNSRQLDWGAWRELLYLSEKRGGRSIQETRTGEEITKIESEKQY